MGTGRAWRQEDLCLVFIYGELDCRFGTTRPLWSEGKQQFGAGDHFGQVGAPSKLSGVVKADCGVCPLKDSKNDNRTR